MLKIEYHLHNPFQEFFTHFHRLNAKKLQFAFWKYLLIKFPIMRELRSENYIVVISNFHLMRTIRINLIPLHTHLWPYSKSKFNLKSDGVNLVAPAAFLTNVRATQYKMGPKRLTRLGNSNVLRLPVFNIPWWSYPAEITVDEWLSNESQI